jgi:subtilisin family serine protease
MNALLRCAAGLFCAIPLAALGAVPPAADYKESELLVKYRSDSVGVSVKSGLGLTTQRQLGNGVELVTLPAMTTVDSALDLLKRDDRVAYAEPNFRRYKRAAVPNDPLFDQQWGLRNTGQANFVSGGPAGTPGADMNLVEAWDANGDGVADRVGSNSVVVAIIDDSVETTHEDLRDNIVAGYDFKDNDNDPNPSSSDDVHGTLVAGCVGAVGNNGIGVAGVSWNSRIMPLRFDYDVASQVQAMNYARDHGAKIINASFGGPGYSQTEYNAIQALADSDILYVAAAGNDDSNIDRAELSYPANYDADNIVSVAALSRQGQISSFSQYGSLSVDVAAPGLQIITTAVHNSYSSADTNGVAGTSFSSPYVAGVAALIRAAYPNATYSEVKARLIESGQNGENAQVYTVGGRVDADRAIEMSPRPSLVVESVTIDAAGNGQLDPGETAVVHVVVRNIWQAAGNAQLSATADNGLTIAGGPVALGTLAQNETASVDLQVTVPTTLTGHRYVVFNFALTADGGYQTNRRYVDEVALLPFDVKTTSSFAGFDADLYDEFHAWHFELPNAAPFLVVESNASLDVDILVKRETPPVYTISLNADVTDNNPDFFCTSGTGANCLDPQTYIGGDTTSGLERVCIPNAQPGTYHIVAVNFSQPDAALPYSLHAYPSSICGLQTGGGGGGSAGTATLLTLMLGALARRLRGLRIHRARAAP